VNVIEPDHGTVFDPACGSGGIFVQSAHFIGQDTARRVTFYRQEKTVTTIKLAKMNLAVHGLEGHIVEANTFYDDEHTLVGKCDFVMANPPVQRRHGRRRGREAGQAPRVRPAGHHEEQEVQEGDPQRVVPHLRPDADGLPEEGTLAPTRSSGVSVTRYFFGTSASLLGSTTHYSIHG
jgi:hypothetical protein